MTKSSGVERALNLKLNLLVPMKASGLVVVYLTVTTLDASFACALEPRAAAPARRLRSIRERAQAGVVC